MKPFFLLIVLLSFLFSSCIGIVTPALFETPGLYSGYRNLCEDDKKSIIFLKEDEKIFKISENDKILAINSEHLRDFINQYDSCLVYFWSYHCASGMCISPVACQEFCDKNNYQLIMIAEYYTFPEMYSIISLINNPLFTINTEYYKTDYCNKYLNQFKKELLKNVNYTLQNHDRYWFFINGEFRRSVNELF